MVPALKLIEKQFAMAAIRDRLNEKAEETGRYIGPDGLAWGPCVLISRECGSGSSDLAENLGGKLGWGVFDARIVDEIARAAHVHQRLVESVDEQVHTHWEQTWRELLLEDLTDKRYLHHLVEIVTALAHHGNAVIVGRGTQYLVPQPCALRVRLVAPIEQRIKRVSELDKVTLEKARQKIIEIDSKRAAFIWKTFKKDIASPLNHDLVINTGEVNIESATRIVLLALHEKLGVSCENRIAFSKQYAAA
jgi:cytidylate kinase